MKYIIQATFLLIGFAANAQVALPYLTGFDSPSQQAGWHEIRVGATQFSDWTVASFQSFSAPNSVTHDYPVDNSNLDTVEDWYISPAIMFTGSARLSFRYYVYSITGGTQPADNFSVWYSSGSDNPANGDYVQLIDLTNTASSSFNWLDTTNIPIPSTLSSGYIAFRYHAVNNWFIPNIDDISIESTSIVQPIDLKNYLSAVPTLMKDFVSIQSAQAITSIALVDEFGRELKRFNNTDITKPIDVSDLSPGVYQFVGFDDKRNISTARVVKQ